ncbi:partial Cobalt/magnesium transport protein CorA, partial [Anaerolineae bacterium]
VFSLHPLALEDVVHVHQRPKVEEYEAGFYLVMRMPRFEGAVNVELEQLSLFFGPGYVVTFQEREGDCLEPVRERLRGSRGRVRQLGADYLAYTLLDAVIDAYFPILEVVGERLELLEDRVLLHPDRAVVEDIHHVKRELIAIRRAIWPLRDAVNRLEREEHPLIDRETQVYLRDCYDHCVQLVELVETYREVATGLLDVYLSSVSNRMNEVMKVLTIIATIFIPLGFVASVYGMNFDTSRSPYNMPELEWRYGYPYVLGLMAAMVIGLLVYFRVKRWI